MRSSNAVYGGNKVTVGMSTTSSMHSEDRMPNVIPQKTNVLTGAATKYYSN